MNLPPQAPPVQLTSTAATLDARYVAISPPGVEGFPGDICQALREYSVPERLADITHRAAREIERLRRANASLRDEIEILQHRLSRLQPPRAGAHAAPVAYPTFAER